MTIQEEADLLRARVQLMRAFTPGAPINRKDLFAGRQKQLAQVIHAVSQVGQHAIIFGERGIGKTSLAGLIHEFWSEVAKDIVSAVRVNGDPTDDFSTIWAKVAEDISDLRKGQVGEGTDAFSDTINRLASGEATPHLVRRCFQASDRPFIVVIDEFDRVTNEEAKRLMADTIKELSDQWVPSMTLVLVGVADSVDGLIREHASIDRTLVQVLLPRMVPAEITDLVTKAFKSIGMTVASPALQKIVGLSQGLPYYAHLLGYHSGLHALGNKKFKVESAHVSAALRDAMENALESVTLAYHQAVASPRKTMYSDVLLACALADVDELGYFAPADIVKPLSKLKGKAYTIPHFMRPLTELANESRGTVLQKTGMPHRRRYRFANPLLKPYVVMKGVEAGLIKPGDW